MVNPVADTATRQIAVEVKRGLKGSPAGLFAEAGRLETGACPVSVPNSAQVQQGDHFCGSWLAIV